MLYQQSEKQVDQGALHIPLFGIVPMNFWIKRLFLASLVVLTTNACAFVHVSTPIGPVRVGGVVTPDGRVGVSAGTRVGNVVIGGSSKPVKVGERKQHNDINQNNEGEND